MATICNKSLPILTQFMEMSMDKFLINSFLQNKKTICKVLIILCTMTLFDYAFLAHNSDARSRMGGRSFSRSRTMRRAPMTTPRSSTRRSTSSGGFMRSMAGGFMGGALGSMLFGGMGRSGMGGGGFGGSGIGLFQILLLGGIAYFIYTRFFRKPSSNYSANHYTPPFTSTPDTYEGSDSFSQANETVNDGLALIHDSDPSFDQEQFKETAQDVFFQVQAGWMRRDIKSYRHLLGEQLAAQYETQLEEMRQKGQINKLENIAVRSVKIVDAGIDGNEEFITISFEANLLDYTVDENSNDIVDGSMTNPVKFSEQWSWSRAIGTNNWRLEGISH